MAGLAGDGAPIPGERRAPMGGPARPENSQQQEAAKMHGKSRSGDDKGDGPETALRTMTRDTPKYKIGDMIAA